MADATAGKLGIGEQNKPTETSAEDSIAKESVNPTTDVENGPNIVNAPDSNVSDIATEDVISKAESIDSPINSLEEESNMSAIEDDSILSDQAIQNGVTPPPIENVHAIAEPEDTDSAMEGSNFDAAGGAPIAESTAEDVSVQQPPVDPELEAQQQEEQRSAVDAAGISQEPSPANTPSEDKGPVEAAESEGDNAAGIVDQALSVPLQSNGDDIEPGADNIVENAEEDQLLGDRDADDVDEELDEEGLLGDQERADGPATQEAAQPPTPEDPQVEQELSVSQEDVPSTINEEQCENEGFTTSLNDIQQRVEPVSQEDASDTETCQQKNETVSPEDASQSPLGSGQEAANQKDDSPSSPTNLEMAEPVNQDDNPPTILKDNQSPNVEHVNPEEAPPTSEDDGASQQDLPSNAESASVQEMSQDEEIASQQENPPETRIELTSTQISAPPSEDAPGSTGEGQPSEKTDDISPESKEDSPMSVTTSPAAEPMEMEPATSAEGDEPMEVDKGDAKIGNEEKMDIDPAGSDDISASQSSAMKGVQASDEKEDTPMPNAAENKETNAQEREKSDTNQESATQDINSAEGDSPIKISKVETVVEDSMNSQIEIKTEHCEPEMESVEEGTGLRITAVSGAAETSASEKQEGKGETEKNVESSSGTKIKEEISEKTGEDLKGYAADTVNEFLNMMGMENLDEKEKQNLNVTEPVSKESPATQTKLEAKPSSKPAGPSAKAPHACLVCGKLGKCKYNIVRNGDTKHLCEDKCFKMFRVSPGAYLKATTPSEADGAQSTGASSDRPQFSKQPIKSCSVCKRHEISSDKFLSWQGMDYCSEDCLDKFMTSMSATCSLCNLIISEYGKGKYCIKVGSLVKPFCSTKCMGEFSKTLKVCSYCQKDLKICKDSFIAPVGLKGKEEFKDFCSQACLKSLEDRVKGKDDKKKGDDIEIIAAKDGTSAGGRVTRSKTGSIPLKCTVCGKIAQIKHEVNFEDKVHQLCSDPCFAAFRYANKLTMNTCDNCGVYCNNEGASPMFIQFEGQQRRFCSDLCVSIFKTNQTKIATCTWCKSTKANFDMIERVDSKNKYQLFCSLNCLSLYRVNLQASSNQRVVCDHCKKYHPAQYHLTMSDASVRNFCCYPCVMAYQSQFQSPQRIPVTPAATQQKAPPPRIPPTNQAIGATGAPSGLGNVPIISNVMSLAPQQNAASPKSRTTKQTSRGTQLPPQNYSPTVAMKSPPQQTPSPTQQVIRKVIIQPPPPKAVKNKSLLCRPLTQTKATSCRPHVASIGVQTDKDKEPKSTLIPIPVPIYIPVPMAMYTYPTPYPLPIPVPIPVPCFIPTTKKSADSILKQIKEIQERMPADPFEAELLMMAEAVASAEGKEDSDSDSDKEDSEVNKPGGDSVIPAVPDVAVPSQDAFGEDMLQMALRMATEMTDQPMDLETSLEPVPVQQGTAPEFSTIAVDPDVIHSPIPTRSRSKGRGRGRRGRGSKRVKVEETPPEPPPPPAPIPDQPPPPDADMHLKYTYGVNAWKHWVIQKNVQLEKVATKGSKLKHFKTDLLQMTADELNFSLCLFVKEVRKPNGEEYAPDSIFYLCLGIQQYLFENGRIDNIFTDFYYEKFTECLHEVVNKYQARLNSAGLLVCRIEEEHLWESKQLGAHSPYVLLNTLVYFNTKYFMLKTPAEHLKLSFSHIMKHWKKSNVPSGKTPGRSVYLRYYAPVLANQKAEPGQKRKRDEVPVFEQGENIENPLRCPVKLYEFYLSKCPESIKSRSDLFYLIPERSCVPDSPVWYSTLQLQIEALNKMLARVMMVREVQEAHMTVQPIYV